MEFNVNRIFWEVAKVTIILGFIHLPVYLIFRKRITDNVKPFVPLMILGFTSSFYELLNFYYLKIDVTTWFRIYTVLEFLVLYHLFAVLLKQKYKILRNFFLIVFFIVLIWLIFFKWSLNNFLEGDYVIVMVESLFVITAISLWMKNDFKATDLREHVIISNRYIQSGLLLYFSGALFVNFICEIIVTKGNYNQINQFWLVSAVLLFINRSLFLLAILKSIKKTV